MSVKDPWKADLPAERRGLFLCLLQGCSSLHPRRAAGGKLRMGQVRLWGKVLVRWPEEHGVKSWLSAEDGRPRLEEGEKA